MRPNRYIPRSVGKLLREQIQAALAKSNLYLHYTKVAELLKIQPRLALYHCSRLCREYKNVEGTGYYVRHVGRGDVSRELHTALNGFFAVSTHRLATPKLVTLWHKEVVKWKRHAANLEV
jgi:hypothetical protein